MSEICAVCEKGKCPTICEICGFSDNGVINRDFFILKDAKYWLETVVKPYRMQWEVKDDRVFYINKSDNYKLYRICVNGTSKQKLSDDDISNYEIINDRLYYINKSDNYKLYRICLNKTDRQKISDDIIDSFEIVKDLVYYINKGDGYKLYRICINGTNRQKISDDNISSFKIVNDRAYYINKSDGYKLYGICVDGTDRRQLNDDWSVSFYVVGNWIFYNNTNDEIKIYKIRKDGIDRQKLMDDIPHRFKVIDNWVFYINKSDENKLYRVCVDGTNRQKLSDDDISNFKIANNLVFFINKSDDYKLYRICVNGTNRQKLSDDDISNFEIANDWVYYSDERKLYRILVDGTAKQKINDDKSSDFIIITSDLEENSNYYNNKEGIKINGKLLSPEETKSNIVEMQSRQSIIDLLLEGVFMFLEDGEWSQAVEGCERIHDTDPENPMAYVGKLCAELKVRYEADLTNCKHPIDNLVNFKKALHFSNTSFKAKLIGYNEAINERIVKEKRKAQECFAEQVRQKQLERQEWERLLPALKIGSIIPFGKYKWRVLDLQSGKALIITEDIIEARPYNTYDNIVTWETCTLRKYLNNDFLQIFSIKEQEKIIETKIRNSHNMWYVAGNGCNDTSDKIFLLSLDEVDIYFGNSGDYQNKRRKGFNGEYQDNGYLFSNIYNNNRVAMNNNRNWWLRSSGTTNLSAATVYNDGVVNVSGSEVNWSSGGVRPALWLKL